MWGETEPGTESVLGACGQPRRAADPRFLATPDCALQAVGICSRSCVNQCLQVHPCPLPPHWLWDLGQLTQTLYISVSSPYMETEQLLPRGAVGASNAQAHQVLCQRGLAAWFQCHGTHMGATCPPPPVAPTGTHSEAVSVFCMVSRWPRSLRGTQTLTLT